MAVELGLPPTPPPAVLYHGTASATVPVILREGLRPMSRQDVHLSAEQETAVRAGARHGRPVVLEVGAAGLAAARPRVPGQRPGRTAERGDTAEGAAHAAG